MSQTLMLERNLSWTGLLVEPDPRAYAILQKRRRNAWTSPLCIKLSPPGSVCSITNNNHNNNDNNNNNKNNDNNNNNNNIDDDNSNVCFTPGEVLVKEPGGGPAEALSATHDVAKQNELSNNARGETSSSFTRFRCHLCAPRMEGELVYLSVLITTCDPLSSKYG